MPNWVHPHKLSPAVLLTAVGRQVMIPILQLRKSKLREAKSFVKLTVTGWVLGSRVRDENSPVGFYYEMIFGIPPVRGGVGGKEVGWDRGEAELGLPQWSPQPAWWELCCWNDPELGEGASLYTLCWSVLDTGCSCKQMWPWVSHFSAAEAARIEDQWSRGSGEEHCRETLLQARTHLWKKAVTVFEQPLAQAFPKPHGIPVYRLGVGGGGGRLLFLTGWGIREP